MPRLRQIARSGKVQRRVEEAVLDDSSEQLQQSIEEADGLLGPEGPGLVQQSSHWLRTMSRALPWEADSKEAGPFLESWWRLHLRLPRGGGGALLAYERAMRLRGYVERASRPNLLAHEPSLDAVLTQVLRLCAGFVHIHVPVVWLHGDVERASRPNLLAHEPSLDGVLTGSVQAQDISDLLGEAKPSVMLEAWGEVPQPERAKLLLQYTHVVTNVRQHGFASVGKLSPHSPLGQLLLHGLQLMLSMAFDGSIRQQLESRLGSAARLYFPNMEKGRLQALYQHNNKAGLLGGQIALAALAVPLPPASSQLPMFDQLSLSCQLSFASDVLQRLLCKDQPLPDDHALSFAAFQKLLLLGLLAPLEEATAAASGRKGGQHVALAAARADRQRIAAARQEEQQGAAAAIMVQLLELLLDVEAVKSQAAEAAYQAEVKVQMGTFLATQQEADGGSSSSAAAEQQQQQQQQQQGQQQVLQQPVHVILVKGLIDEDFWRLQAVQLYRSSRPEGWRWLGQHFEDASSSNNQPGFWGLVRYFLSYDQLNLRFREAGVVASAVRATWKQPGWNPAENEAAIGLLSRQAARCANKMQALAAHSIMPVWPDSNPIAAGSLAALLQLACLSGSAPCLLAYCDLKPAAKAAAAAATAAAHSKGSSSGSSTHAPAANGVYPDPDMAREVRRNPVAVCREAEQMRLRQYSAAWSTHLAMLDASMVEVMAEYGEVRQKEEERLQKEGQLQKDSSSSKAASGGAAFAASMIGAGLKAGAAGMWGPFGAGMWGGMGRQQQQQQQGAGARFGAKPFQGVGMSDSSLFGHGLDGLD
ncbi:hypothetical protein OEZ85_000601 [Tetradesmus obliquus]|uniref:ELYS-like domain-containing protein n=1 Tax=Tetradesmus obliquus TaxID=3088 RepID=A0ABY8UIN0_TETOB|nr:hypothetical protein OEZ85_000601 [Tetradesmus obliquus]